MPSNISMSGLDSRLSAIEDGSSPAYLTALTEAMRQFAVPRPDFYMPLISNLDLVEGFGSATFSRASTATYINKSGVLTAAAVDTPRFEREGLLIEGASTNLINQSTDLSSWDTRGATLSAMTNGFGSFTSYRVTETTDDGIHAVTIPINVGNTQDTTLSVFVKSSNRGIRLLINTSLSPFNGVFSVPNDGQFHRISITRPASPSGGPARIWVELVRDGQFDYMGDGTSYIEVVAPQLEELPFASSYIPTSGGNVTRAADLLSVTTENNISDADSSTISITGQLLGHVPGNLTELWASKDVYKVRFNSATGLGFFANTGRTINTNTNSMDYQVYAQTSDMQQLTAYINGVNVGSNTSSASPGSLNAATKLGSNMFFGHLRDFKGWFTPLTHQQVALLG